MANQSYALARIGAFALALTVAAGAALAAGSGGSSSGSTTPRCSPGMVYDPTSRTCVRKNSGLIDDRQLYEQGRALAQAGRYEEALDALTAIDNHADPMVFTMIGYARRKLGDIDAGMAYYRQALAIDPDNLNTREYLGEAYVALGRLDLARAELAKVEALCGRACEQYEDLAAAIAGQPAE